MSNTIPFQLVKRLHIKLEKTPKAATISNRAKSGALGKVRVISVSFENIKARLEFVNLRNVQLVVIIWCQTLKRPGRAFCFRSEVVCFGHYNKWASVPMVPEYTQPQKFQDVTDSEDFTFVSSGEEAERNVRIDKHKLVLMLFVEVESIPAAAHIRTDGVDTDEKVWQELSTLRNLSEEKLHAISNLIVHQNEASLSLRIVKTVHVLYCHQFKRTDEKLVYDSARRSTQTHNDTVQKELSGMLQNGTSTRFPCTWSCTVVIATQEDGKPHFRIHYGGLDQEMNANLFPLPIIQEIFDGFAEEVFLITLNLFSGYWKIKLVKNCKQDLSFISRQKTF